MRNINRSPFLRNGTFCFEEQLLNIIAPSTNQIHLFYLMSISNSCRNTCRMQKVTLWLIRAVGGIKVTGKSLKTLILGSWIDDEIINWYIALCSVHNERMRRKRQIEASFHRISYTGPPKLKEFFPISIPSLEVLPAGNMRTYPVSTSRWWSDGQES